MNSHIAVLLPVLENQVGLNKSLESLRCVSGSFDVLVVDDGSAVPIVVPPELRSDVPVVLLRTASNVGIAAALNRGLAYALEQGYGFIARLDAGDTIAPERFERQFRFLVEHPDCAAVSSSVVFVDAGGNTLFRYRGPIHPAQIARRLHIENCMMHPACMIRASSLRQVGLYREDVPKAEDYELFLRLAQHYRLAALPEALTQLDYDPRGLSVAGRRQQRRSRLRLQVKYFDPRCLDSFLGLARSLIAMAVPAVAVLRFKRSFMR